MKRFVTKLAIVVLSFFCLFPPASVLAEDKLQGYTIDVSSLNSQISKYITALNTEEQKDGTFSLYINNSYIGNKNGDPLNFSYYPNSSTTIAISISPSNETINLSFSQRQEEIYNSAFIFTIDAEGAQSVTFYPSANSSSGAQTKTVKGSGGVFDFGSFSYTFGITPVTFSVVLNANNNTATITKNGSSKTYGVSKSTTTRTLYFENFVQGHAINMNYMEKELAKQTYANAKVIDYADSEIDAAVQNETLTLINSTTNKTYTVPLRRTIGYWARESGGAAGTGEYGAQGGDVQVVCEWHDAACSSIRSSYGEAGRLYAVYGSSSSYPAITSYTKAEYIYPTLYQNWNWYDSDWTNSSYYPSSLGQYGIVQYQYRTKSLSDWSAWQEEPISCGSFCRYMSIESKNYYKQRTKSWGTWSDYTLTSCSTDDTETKQCESKIMYRQAFRNWGAWTSWATGNDCGLFSGSSCEEESRTMYRYRTRSYTAPSYGTWSSWSGYEYSLFGCSESSEGGSKVKECRSTTAYAMRKIGDWSGWGSYSTTVCSPTYSGANNTQVTGCMSRTEYRKATRSYQYKSCANSACGVSSYSYSSYKYTYGSKPSPAYNCSSSTVTSSSCGTKTQYAASCSCINPSTNKKTCTGAYYDTKTPCTVSGCSSRKCSYSSKSVNKSCTRYYCATARTANYNSCRTSGCGEESWGSWSSWSTTSCSASTNVKCETRTTYAKRTRSWGSYGDYSLDTTYISNTLYDYKTQTWYGSRTRTYKAASVGDWSSWTSYIYSSCSSTSEGGYLTKECNSQTQYRSRELGEYGAWSGYNYDINSSEYTSCANSNLCKQESAIRYRTRSRNAWTSWSDSIYTSCTPSSSGTIIRECQEVKKYRAASIIYGDWSSWYRTTSARTGTDTMEYQYRYNNGVGFWSETKGNSSTLGTNTYYTGESKASTTKKLVNVKYAQTTSKNVGSLSEMTAAAIANKTEEIKKELILNNAYSALKTTPVLYDDVEEYANKSASLINSQALEDAHKYFEGRTIFISYFYITPHWRAVSAQADVSGYNNETLTSVVTGETIKSSSQGMKLIPYDIDLTKDTKIIYYDYRDPLINYHDELPENWQGYEELIGELQHSDLTNYKIEVELSRDDLQAMKDYLKTHNYESNDCEMLREFSYIFKTTDSDLAKFLATGKGCKIEGD